MERAINTIKAFADWLVKKRVVKLVTQFETICCQSAKYIRNVSTTGKGKPGVETIAAIYEVFQSASLKWLMTG